MTRKYLSILILFIICPFISHSQAWQQKTSMTGLGRIGAVAFVINNIAYCGAGYGSTSNSDFWKYDPVTDSWSQVASMPVQRTHSFAFALGIYGYVGGGVVAQPQNNFYRYDSGANSWMQKATLPVYTYGAFSFSIGDLGYFGTGVSYSGTINQFYEYNPISDLWTAKTPFGGGKRVFSGAFVIDTLAYVVGGQNTGNSGDRRDCWSYSPTTGLWTLRDSLPGNGRIDPGAFSINGKGYICGGTYGGAASLFDCYSYDPVADAWTSIAQFPGLYSRESASFSINNIGYMCSGYDGVTSSNELWALDPTANGIESINNKSEIQSMIIHKEELSGAIEKYFPENNSNIRLYDVTGKIISNDFQKSQIDLDNGIYWFVSERNKIKVLVVE